MVIKKKVKICLECEKEIQLSDDKHVLLGTYTGDQVNDESYFHFKCFVKWYNHKVSEKAKNSVSTMQSKVQGLMSDPKIAGLLSMVGGVDKLKGMMNTDLDAGVGGMDLDKIMSGLNIPEEKPKIIKKTNNGRTKKGKTKPKI